MRCPHCGDKIHDPGLDRFCPSCGEELPHESPEDRSIVRDRSISILLLVLSITTITVGGGFVMSDAIIYAIDPEMHLMYWPYDTIALIIGVAMLAVRHPFAKRSRKYTAVILKQAQAMWTCSYCGADNVPGSKKCDSCGAPLKKT